MSAVPSPDPVRQRHIDALQRRAAQHQGPARRVIEARLQELRGGAVGAAGTAAVTSTATVTVKPGPSPLRALLTYVAQHSAPSGELKAVHDYRGTWARLGMEQRLQQTMHQVPDNAVPLNTQRLLHQALKVMSDTSPAYLQHFMQHVDGLLALSQLRLQDRPAAAVRKPAGR